jgi:hypothetical protein
MLRDATFPRTRERNGAGFGFLVGNMFTFALSFTYGALVHSCEDCPNA